MPKKSHEKAKMNNELIPLKSLLLSKTVKNTLMRWDVAITMNLCMCTVVKSIYVSRMHVGVTKYRIKCVLILR